MRVFKGFVAALAFCATASAWAQQVCDGGTVSSPNPSFSDLNVAPGKMTSCIGFFNKNQFFELATVTAVNEWLKDNNQAELAYTVTGKKDDPKPQVDKIAEKTIQQSPGGVVNFGTTLFGDTLVGLHWGNYLNNPGQTVTAFYLFDAGTDGLNSITVNALGGWSNAFLYSTEVAPPIPEPETYALMLAGLGAVGLMARRRKARGS